MSWSNKPNVVALYVYLIGHVNFIEGEWNGLSILPGQHATSRAALSRHTGLSERQVRSAITTLQKSNILTYKTTNKYTLITLCDFGGCSFSQKYNDQQNDQQNDQENDQQTTSRTTTIKERVISTVTNNTPTDITQETIIESLNRLATNFYENGSEEPKRLLLQLAEQNGIGENVVTAFIMANVDNMAKNEDYASHPNAICDNKGVIIRDVAKAFIGFSKAHNAKAPRKQDVHDAYHYCVTQLRLQYSKTQFNQFYEYVKSTGKQYKGLRGLKSAAFAWIGVRTKK